MKGPTGCPTRVLLVDLNNFARYPTLSIGYLVAALRGSGIGVEVLCPLNHGIHPAVRERPERLQVHLERRVFFSTHPAVAPFHELLRAAHERYEQRPHPQVLREVATALDKQTFDALLLSAYLDHYPSVKALAALAKSKGIPVLLGGPMFNMPDVAREWIDLPGLTAVVGAEVDLALPEIVATMLQGGDLTQYPGVYLPDGTSGKPAPPLAHLGRLPVPDFSDFPWDRYPNRVIPLMAGRGCSWGRCLFCSDVVNVNGRTFRTRPLQSVLAEIEKQSDRYASKAFMFLDIKLNSDLEVWRGLIHNFQHVVPGARWIGTVHVQSRGDNGLTQDDLRAAHASGMRRISFGLETGSQRVNNSMAKGTSLERTSEFIRYAHETGLSVRASMMLGYPGETAEDVRATIGYVQAHERYLDRLHPSLFKAIPGTRFSEQYRRRPDRYPHLRRLRWNPRQARASYTNSAATDPAYRRAKRDLLDLIHKINAKPLSDDAFVFDGMM